MIFIMEKTTFKAYKQAIREHFFLVREEEVSGILVHPSPAQLRTFCQLLCDKGLSRSDEDVFRLFFEPRADEALKKAIDRVNIDKFKTLISFLKGEKDTDITIRIELAAIIVGFTERPYKVFAKSTLHETSERPKHVVLPLVTQKEEPQSDTKELHRKGFLFWIEKHKLIAVFIIIVALFGGFLLSQFVFKPKQFMQWQKDHYEVVAYEANSLLTPWTNEIIPLQQELLHFKKVEVSDTTVFFRHGKPLYWYCKVGDTPEFFTSLGNGRHPETDGVLKPVSRHIVKKYVLKED